MLQLLGECNELAGHLLRSITDETPPSLPMLTPAVSPLSVGLSLPSKPSPLLMPSILSDDTENAPVPTPSALATPPPCDTAAVHVSRAAPDYHPSPPRNTRSTYARARRVAAASFHPSGLFALFVPGGLTLDSQVQHIYNGFLYDVPATGATRQLYLITCSRRVGIFASW